MPGQPRFCKCIESPRTKLCKENHYQEKSDLNQYSYHTGRYPRNLQVLSCFSHKS